MLLADTLHVIFMLEGMFCRKALIFLNSESREGSRVKCKLKIEVFAPPTWLLYGILSSLSGSMPAHRSQLTCLLELQQYL